MLLFNIYEVEFSSSGVTCVSVASDRHCLSSVSVLAFAVIRILPSVCFGFFSLGLGRGHKAEPFALNILQNF